MTRSEGIITFLSVSDIHLGNIRTPTNFILDNLEQELFCAKIAALDLLIIAGDLFDRQLEYNHPSSGRILLFVDQILNECSTHNVKLRILEGTPSHDNKQNKIFDDLYATDNYTCDMKYVDTLSVEHIEQWGIKVLYVPDKIRPTCQLVYDDTIKMFESLGITEVDLAIIHGTFSHQLPIVIKESYDPLQWLKLVKHWILLGHVHIHSIFNRIVASGSFDRLAQGEEGPKGYLMGSINLKDTSKDEIYFIENTRAKKYITIDCTYLTLEDSLSKLRFIIENTPNESYIRIKAKPDNPIVANITEVKKFNLSNIYSILTEDESEQELNEVIDDELDNWVAININKDNICDIILKRLSIKNTSGDILSLVEKFIKMYR